MGSTSNNRHINSKLGALLVGTRYHRWPTTGGRGAARPTFTAGVVGRVAPRAPRTFLKWMQSWLRL